MNSDYNRNRPVRNGSDWPMATFLSVLAICMTVCCGGGLWIALVYQR